MGNFWVVAFLFDLKMIHLQLLLMAALIIFSLVLVVVTIYLHPEKADNLQPLQSDHILNVVSPIFWNYWMVFLKERMIGEVLLTINIDYCWTMRCSFHGFFEEDVNFCSFIYSQVRQPIPDICHRRHGRRPCKFFLAGVIFFSDLTRKIDNLLCILPQ